MARRFVFPEGWLRRHQLGEFALFILSGLFGAAITSAVVWAVSGIPGAGIHWPKIAATAVSFAATYVVRKYFVFRSTTRQAAP